MQYMFEDLTPQELIYVYGFLMKRRKKLIQIKETPNCPIHEDSLIEEINILTSITNKIKNNYPSLQTFDEFIKP